MHHYFTKTLTYLFTNLYRHMAIISKNGHSHFYKVAVILTYTLILIRTFANCIAWNYDIELYFEYDILAKRSLFKGFSHKYLFFVICLSPIFFTRLFVLLNCNSAQGKFHTVWSHFLYDLVVRNRDQAKLQKIRGLQTKVASFTTGNSSWFTQVKNAFTLSHFRFPRLQIQVSKYSNLLYHRNLDEKQRFRCLILYVVYELYTCLFLFRSLFFNFLMFLGRTRKIWSTLTSGQTIYLITTFLMSEYIYYTSEMSKYLLMYTLLLVSYVYAGEYHQKVNRMLKVHNRKRKCSQINNQILAVYRANHTHFTRFILLFNSSTVSPFISAFLYIFLLPYHSFVVVFFYYFRNSMTGAHIVQTFLSVIFDWLDVLLVTLALAKVNREIGRSGRHLGSLFAAKGSEKKFAKGDVAWVGLNRKLLVKNNWIRTSKGPLVNTRENLKLAAYYEQVWRSDKQLAFTVGQETTMSWKFIASVSA